MLECDVCGHGVDAANAMYETRMRRGRTRRKFTLCDHCRAGVIDAQASTMTMKTDEIGARDEVEFSFVKLDASGTRTRDRSSITLTARAVRALPVKFARPLGLKP